MAKVVGRIGIEYVPMKGREWLERNKSGGISFLEKSFEIKGNFLSLVRKSGEKHNVLLCQMGFCFKSNVLKLILKGTL